MPRAAAAWSTGLGANLPAADLGILQATGGDMPSRTKGDLMKRHGALLLAVLLVLLCAAPASATEWNGFTHKVLGYHLSWRPWTDAPGMVPWSHFSHISYFALAAKRDGTFGYNDFCGTPPVPCWTADTFRSLATAGHTHQVKVGVSLVALNGPDQATYQQWIHEFLQPDVRDDLILNLVATLQAAGADGVDVDIEWPALDDADEYAAFVAELTTAVHTAIPGSYVFVAAPAWDYPPLNTYANNYLAMATSSDGLAIMGYGYHSDRADSEPGPISPISNGTTWFNPPYDLKETLDYFASLGVPLNKQILGFPVYAIEWPTTSAAVPGTWDPTRPYGYPVVKDNYPYASGPIDDCERLFSVAKQWDTASQTPYRVRQVAGKYQQLFCEDLASMTVKYQLVIDRQIAGTLFWAENYIPHNYPFWRLLDQKFMPAPPANQAPVVSITPHAPAVMNQPFTLACSSANCFPGTTTPPADADGDGLILQWSLQSGPANNGLTFAAANEKTFTATLSKSGTYTFKLTATDGIVTSTATTVLTVNRR
jgi:spore germination protein YaaH